MIPGMMKDKNYGEGGLNPWSVGDIYPLVIARIEVGASFKYWNVLNADDDMSGFASYDDAFLAAKGYLAAKAVAKPVLSPFNPAAYDAEMTEDFVACMRGDFEAAERMSMPEPGYGNRFYDNGNGSGVMSAEIDLDLARNKAIAAARDLHNKLALTMTYSEFDKGFHEWAALGDALMAVAAAREKVRNA